MRHNLRFRARTAHKTRLAYLPSIALAMTSPVAPSQAQKVDERPNILLVLSDDQSARFVGCYGDAVIRTPNIDRFAGEVLKFERATSLGALHLLSKRGDLLI